MVEQSAASPYFNEQLETMSRSERERYESAKLQETIARAYANAPAVREKCQRAGVSPEMVRTVRDLEKVPITRKDELLELHKQTPFGGLLAVPRERLKRVFMSPGPIFDLEGDREDYWRWAGPLYAAGFRRNDVALNSTSYHLTPLGLMFDEGLRVVGCTVIPGGVGNTEQQVRIAQYAGATGFVGMPSFLMMLLEKAEELGLDLSKDLRFRRALVAGEMLPESLRQAIEEKAGMTVRQAYGTADIGAVSYECMDKTGMHIANEVIVEIVDPATGKQVDLGETGEIVVTSFDETYALIRFGTGDLSYMVDEPCPCGRTAPRLAKILGRVGDAAKVRGMFVHPREVESVISSYPQLASFQLKVSRFDLRDHMLLQVELREPEDEEALRRDLSSRLGSALKLKVDSIEFVHLGTIPQGSNKIVDERKWD